MLAIGLSATLAAQADGSAVCEDELDVVECLSRWSGEEQEIDLRTCWSIEKQNEIPLSYSAVGWGTEAAPAGEVRLVCVDGSFNAGVFFPSLTAFDLAAGLTGKGVYRWYPLVDRKIYRVQHLVTRGGTPIEDETLSAYFDFRNCKMVTAADILAAVQGISQPMRCGVDVVHPWSLIGGDGDGVQNSADGAQLVFSFTGAGMFSAELAFTAGSVIVTLDGRTVDTVPANAQATEHAWSVADYGLHTLTLTYSGSAGISVRNCAVRDGEGRVLSSDVRADLPVDLRTGVRAPHYFSDILPFTYSSVNWIGDVAGSASRVSIVPLAGAGPDVTKWTPSGAASMLYDGPGEGAVKWKPSAGVWKASFEIEGTDHREDVFFDLRRTRQRGFAVYIF